MTHTNSLDSYFSDIDKFKGRKKHILNFIKRNPNQTSYEITKSLGFEQVNSIRPRVSELLKANIILECGKKICDINKKNVSIYCYNKNFLTHNNKIKNPLDDIKKNIKKLSTKELEWLSLHLIDVHTDRVLKECEEIKVE